jgi:hypothetical protein
MASTRNDFLRRLARLGAMRRIAQLQAEASEILKQFPEFSRSGAAARATPSTADDPGGGRRTRARRTMTAAQRKAVGARMKKYWAERRSAAKK